MPIKRVAILLANPAKIELEPEFPDDGIKYYYFFKQFLPKADFQIYRVLDNVFPQIDDADLFIITGSVYAAYDQFDWIEKLKDFIQKLHQLKKPLIGICFGHQVIAQALGGLVEKSTKGWGLGTKKIAFNKNEAWMTPAHESLQINHIHQDQVVKLPPEASLIAGDDFCPYTAFRIDKHIITCQGHPEFSNDYMKALLPVIKTRFPELLFDQAIATLKKRNDGDIFGQWLINFVTDNQ